MKTEYIKTFDNVILGIIETADNGDQTARSYPSRRILGYYKAALNRTTDFLGRVVSQGNTVVSLIYKEKQGK